MNKEEKFIIAKNAVANVTRGGADAIVAIALPAVLTRAMTPDAYGAWALVLQLSAYVGYFGFGLQTAVGRFIAHSTERGDRNYRDRIVSTSTATLIVIGVLAFFILLVSALFLPQIFQKMTPALQAKARASLLLVGGALALGLPASVFHGTFVGLQRNEISALIVGGSRLMGGALLALTAWQRRGLIPMAVVLATVNFFSYVVAYLVARRIAPDIRFDRGLVSLPVAKDLFQYCYSLGIWSAAMLLITGLDLTIVGILKYSAVAYYAVAAGLVTFLSGLLYAVFHALMPAAAVLHARGDYHALGRMLIRGSRYGTFLLILTGLPLILFATPILRIWVGQSYAVRASNYLIILVLANIIRLFLTPYSVILIGTAQQRLVILSPIAEGITNLIASMGLGYLLGPIGVAYGTLCGSVIGVVINVFHNMPRTSEVKFGLRQYFNDALLRPIAFTLPLLFCAALFKMHRVGSMTEVIMTAASIGLSATILWSLSLLPSEKVRLLRVLGVEGQVADREQSDDLALRRKEHSENASDTLSNNAE